VLQNLVSKSDCQMLIDRIHETSHQAFSASIDSATTGHSSREKTSFGHNNLDRLRSHEDHGLTDLPVSLSRKVDSGTQAERSPCQARNEKGGAGGNLLPGHWGPQSPLSASKNESPEG